jgi:anthranilate synthase component 2
MKIFILNNYDSFTFMLAHYLEQFCDDISVKRNDEISLGEVDAFDAIVLSPRPGLPEDAIIMPELIKCYLSTC